MNVSKLIINPYWPSEPSDLASSYVFSTPVVVDVILYGYSPPSFVTKLSILIDGITNTSLWTNTNQYGVTKNISLGTIVYVNSTSPFFNGTSFDTAHLIARVVNARLITITPTSFVTVFVGDGMDDGGNCTYCGYHQSFKDTMGLLTSPKPDFVYQIIEPEFPFPFGQCFCDPYTTWVHEVVETCVNGAYYDFIDDGEIMDLCWKEPSVSTSIGGFVFDLPLVWSNKDNACMSGVSTNLTSGPSAQLYRTTSPPPGLVDTRLSAVSFFNMMFARPAVNVGTGVGAFLLIVFCAFMVYFRKGCRIFPR